MKQNKLPPTTIRLTQKGREILDYLIYKKGVSQSDVIEMLLREEAERIEAKQKQEK